MRSSAAAESCGTSELNWYDHLIWRMPYGQQSEVAGTIRFDNPMSIDASVKHSDQLAAELVVDHVRRLILEGKLTKGAQLSTERELVQELGVSRTSVRAGLRSLTAKGVLVARRGAGTFVAAGPPVLDTDALGIFATLHGV